MTTIKRHGGFAIQQDDGGYFWSEREDHFETLADAKASVDRFNHEDRDSDPSWPPPDTPSLGDFYTLDY